MIIPTKIARVIKGYISRYGEDFRLAKGDSPSFKGVLQPSFSGEYLTDSAGYADARKYRIYLEYCDVTALLKEGDRLANDRDEFAISRVEPFTLSGGCVYFKAIV